MLKQRIITSLWGIPLLIAAVWFDAPLPWFTVLIALWGLLAAFEYYRILYHGQKSPVTWDALVLILLFILSRNSELLSLLEPYVDTHFVFLWPLALTLTLPLQYLIFPERWRGPGKNWLWAFVGVFYIGWMLSHLVALRGLDDGRNWVLYTLFVIFASDTTAFFVGRAIGKNKLAPDISPGKTWEGALGAFGGAVLMSLLFTLDTTFGLPLNWWQAILLGLIVSVFGQAGDLTESFFKRRMGVKDSGRYVPGHGGFLDRLDSILFGGLAVYYFVLLTSI